MEAIRKKFPNHTEIAYREAVSKLKYLLAESYAPRIAFARKPVSMRIGKRGIKDNIHVEEYVDDVDIQSVISDMSKREPSTRNKYYTSRLSHFPLNQLYSSNSEKLTLPPAEVTAFIERQEEYIDQLERESQYCREELKSLVEKVKEVVAENEALQDKNKSGFFKSVHENCGNNPGEDAPRSARRSASKPLEGPSIVFESRISELEAQLTQARLELRKAREENQDNLVRLAERKDEPQLHLELERALREKRELEAKEEELHRELGRFRARDTDVELRSKRAVEVVQHAEFEKAQAEAEVRRLKDELEKRQEKLREALQDTSKRLLEEKQQVERRYNQQMEQLSADVASHWEAASKSHLESEKQKREIADLKRDLAQKNGFIEDMKKEMQTKISKIQEELNQAIAEKDASQEEISTIKLASERNERQARQEQSRLQSEINSYKMRLERADADLVHARRENLRLTEGIASLEKEINMNKIVEETRVGSQPPRFEKGKDEKDKDKELASLIFDLENKQAKTVASLEDSLNKQASQVSRLTAECQSLTQRLESNDQNHKKKMANLQNNIEYLSNKLEDYFEDKEENEEEPNQTLLDTIPSSSEIIKVNIQEENNNVKNPQYNKTLNSPMQQSFEQSINDESNNESFDEINSPSYMSQSIEEQNYVEDQKDYENDNSNQYYNQYDSQYDTTQNQKYNNQQNVENREHFENQKHLKNEQYPENEKYLQKKNSEEKLPSEKERPKYLRKREEKPSYEKDRIKYPRKILNEKDRIKYSKRRDEKSINEKERTRNFSKREEK